MNLPTFNSAGFQIPFCGKETQRSLIRNDNANDIILALNTLGRIQIRRTSSKTDRVIYSDSNVIIELSDTASSPESSGLMGVERMKIATLGNNTLICHKWGGSVFDTSVEFTVAKPPELRHVASDTIYGTGATYTYPTGGTALNDTNSRIASSAGYDSENHKVVLPYEVGREIYVATVSSTGITGVTLIDLNIAGRFWSSVPSLPIP